MTTYSSSRTTEGGFFSWDLSRVMVFHDKLQKSYSSHGSLGGDIITLITVNNISYYSVSLKSTTHIQISIKFSTSQ